MSGPASPMGISWRTIIGGDRKSRNFDFLQMQDPKVDVRRLKLMSGGSVSNRIGAGQGANRVSSRLPSGNATSLYILCGCRFLPGCPALGGRWKSNILDLSGDDPVYWTNELAIHWPSHR